MTETSDNLKPSSEKKQAASLDSPGIGSAIATRIHYDINSYAIEAYHDPHRWHLGASEIGDDCARKLWYKFHWCGQESGGNNPNHDEQQRHNNFGRKLRLLQRGNLEESRYIEYLKGIGCEVWTVDANGLQFRMNAVNGHFGGSIDGAMRLPPRYGIEEVVLLEFKTNGTGAGFNGLTEKKLAVHKPQHQTQMNCYGNHMKLRYGCYMNTNKNDDDMYVEVVALNWQQAQQFEAKAERIITTDEPPPRLAENPTYFKCVQCEMKSVCHERKLPEFNCRSCSFARPVTGGEWNCGHHNAVIPREYVPKGCQHYRAIVNG